MSSVQTKQFWVRANIDLTLAERTSFGIASIALSLVPLFGPAFMFTTAAGAALWAADIERNERGSSGSKDEAGGKDLVEEVHPGRLDL